MTSNEVKIIERAGRENTLFASANIKRNILREGRQTLGNTQHKTRKQTNILGKRENIQK